jgi:outer membrane scaffolding protein for murein synthesis (MipA/OmpV family)
MKRFLQHVRTRRTHYVAFFALAGAAACPLTAHAQTPAPLQEWQYSGGEMLERLFEPEVPAWREVVGVGAEARPLYEGSAASRVQGGPVINIRYKDVAFFSTGEGLGVNLLNSSNYRAGIALGYDQGRRSSQDLEHLKGLADLPRSPIVKLFGTYVVSKEFPLVIRADVREITNDNEGLLGDLGVYMPLPGSCEKFVMFAGPSVSYADHRYMQKSFGVLESESAVNGDPAYNAHGGASAYGFGFSSTYFFSKHWMMNVDAAVNHLLGSAAQSPITQRDTQKVLALSVAYRR